jgi:spore germination protein GerM
MPLALTEPSGTVPQFAAPHDAVPISIFLLGPDGELTKAFRYAPPPVTPQKVLNALAAGPYPRELSEGIESAVPLSSALRVLAARRGVLTVALDSGFASLLPGQAPYFFAEIVYSLTSLPGVNGVEFKYKGSPITPEIGNGSLATGYVVSRADYKQVAP